MARTAEPALPRPLSPQRLGLIRKRLLAWYEAHAQPFPWREARDPYAALVAAVCAQQTQMTRVLEIYERWMAAFPTLEALAAAPLAEAIRVWGRAGYPRRAQFLHQTARLVVEKYDGRLPPDRAALEMLPGVGPFTAAIVLNFGFGVDSAAVDTNIVRVIGRVLFGDLQPARETAAGDIRWAVERLLPTGSALRWNPALMDFGAAVCAPTPRCGECPLASLCAARPRFQAGETAVPVRAQGRFAGSQRELRGLLLARLRAAGPLEEEALLRAVARAARVKRARVVLAARSLAADGLAVRGGSSLSLPEDRRSSGCG